MGAVVKGGLKIIGGTAASWLGWEAGERFWK
ncbi:MULTISPECIES: GatA family leaderless bacteriocin [Bacillales]|nr:MULTISPECIES: GatA family leaderless bacteriocin [Bacillales]EKS8379202.1 GatA family leaderless bacteriocin [Bacillus cereus]EKS8385308.1 GatA family leaderless bacteriocin [Bacillus cereus]EMA7400871.1 GatA family leaderless bacteriocin [Bacillus cereus]MBK3959446.1 GatA family leaderless bacteriocin [Staphylococcus haemolyticus]MDA1937129.1 GatA family leaderless bacteriocin [Bacillus cereus]